MSDQPDAVGSPSDAPNTSDQDAAPRQPAPVRHRSRAVPPAAEAEPDAVLPTPEPTAADAPTNPSAGQEPQPVRNYAIGRGKPPKHTQFRPGRSGNPKGRPKGARSLSTLVDEALSQQVTAKVNGRMRKMSVREALARRLVEQALRGDLKALATLVKLDPRATHSEAGDPEQARSAVTPEEEALLLSFLKRNDDAEDDQ